MKDIKKMNWKEFSDNFGVKVEGAEVQVVPSKDVQKIELRIETGQLFSFCMLTVEEANKIIEKTQQAIKLLNK